MKSSENIKSRKIPNEISGSSEILEEDFGELKCIENEPLIIIDHKV